MKKLFTFMIMTAAVIVFAVSAWNVAVILKDRHTSALEYGRLREAYVPMNPVSWDQAEAAFEASPNEPQYREYPESAVDMQGLLEKNPDAVAWISYEDANISYPVVQEQEDEPGKYLHTTFGGSENPSGCIFVSNDADAGFRQKNTFIYGHNMKNGEMFGHLKDIYREPEQAVNPYFYLWTMDGQVIRFRMIAAYVVAEDSSMYYVPQTAEEYENYVDQAMELGSAVQRFPLKPEEKEAIEAGNPLVTLSTCYGAADTPWRLLVQGVEIERKDSY